MSIGGKRDRGEGIRVGEEPRPPVTSPPLSKGMAWAPPGQSAWLCSSGKRLRTCAWNIPGVMPRHARLRTVPSEAEINTLSEEGNGKCVSSYWVLTPASVREVAKPRLPFPKADVEINLSA